MSILTTANVEYHWLWLDT